MCRQWFILGLVLIGTASTAHASVVRSHGFSWWDAPNAGGVVVTQMGAAIPNGATHLLDLEEWHLDQGETTDWYEGTLNDVSNLPTNPFNAANRTDLLGSLPTVAGAQAFIYRLTNISYGSGNSPLTFANGSGFNGLSGINISDTHGALSVSSPVVGSQFMSTIGATLSTVLDLTPGSTGGVGDWDFNANSGPGNFEWDIASAPGVQQDPSPSAVFGYAMPGEWLDAVNGGWVHSWDQTSMQVNSADPGLPGGFSGPKPLQSIPEPMSIAVWSLLALVGLGLIRRRAPKVS